MGLGPFRPRLNVLALLCKTDYCDIGCFFDAIFFFGAFAFNKVKLTNPDLPEGSRNSADLHLSDRGPVVSLNVMDNSAIGDG